jgi:FtsP/CotA-like multicopper oxidase with cupredoxin domain
MTRRYQKVLPIKKYKLLFGLLLLVSTLFGQKEVRKQYEDKIIYTCPMDPQVQKEKPGSCPICGMNLVKKKIKVQKKIVAPKPNNSTPKSDMITPRQEKENIEQQPAEVAKKIDTIINSFEPTKLIQKPVNELVKVDLPLVNTKKYVAKTIRYDLYIKDTIVNFSGKNKRAIAVNGQIPMPTLTFTEGDTALIYVHNELNESSSLHWHGLFLPNKEDGVPNLTQMPIAPHTSHLYKFPIIQHGTHWYHSHSGLQEQIGMYGLFIMNKVPLSFEQTKAADFRKNIDDLPTIPIILSEWTDRKPENVHRMLHNATDWFAIQKGTTQSYAEAIRQGYLKTKVTNELKRMNAMDVSDVFYDESGTGNFKGGDKVRLRIVNGGASTYFWLTYSGGKMTVVANDGNDVEPVEVDRLIVAVSETYDVIVSLPNDNVSYEFLATSEDRTKSTSLFLGNGIKLKATTLPKLKYFEGMKMMNGMMKMNGDLDDMDMRMSLNKMDMNSVMYPEITGDRIVTLNYSMLKSPTKTALPKANEKILRFELSGNMNRYVWSLDNRVVSETDKILIKKGGNVRIILYNGSMMRHPMHLHGHDFRLLNGQGDYAPLKNIVDIMPMETDTLEFHANVEGDWFFHCHILYHMMSGMGRVFSYENQAPNPLIPNPKLAKRQLFAADRKFHIMFENDLASNGNDGHFMLQNTRWNISTEWRLGYHDFHGYESETHIGRYIGKMQWLMPFIGYDFRYRKKGINYQEKNIFGQSDTKDTRKAFSLGVSYTLPMLVKFEAEVFTDKTVLLALKREDIPVSKRIRANFMINSDKEYMFGGKYIVNRVFSISSHYDSDMGFGVGLNLKY